MWGSSQGFYHFETKFINIAGCIKTVCVIEFSALNQSSYYEKLHLLTKTSSTCYNYRISGAKMAPKLMTRHNYALQISAIIPMEEERTAARPVIIAASIRNAGTHMHMSNAP